MVGDRHYRGAIESLNAKIAYLCLEEPVAKAMAFDLGESAGTSRRRRNRQSAIPL